MLEKFYLLVNVFGLYFSRAIACAGGGTADSQIYTNPSFMLEFNPPAAWTYPGGSPQTQINYFPGQPLTQTEANTNALGALKSAMLSALAEANINTVGIDVTPTYTAPQVSDCNKAGTATMMGAMVGIYEAGAITQLATLTTGTVSLTPDCPAHNYAMNMPTYQPFIQQASIKVSGITASGYTLRQVANSLMSLLNFNNHAIFTKEITYS